MSNVIKLFNDAPSQLRQIADEMDESKNKGAQCTVIWGKDIYQCMDSKAPIEDAAATAVFNCQFGISKLMHAAVTGEIDD